MNTASLELERHLERQMRSQERQLIVLRLAVAAIASLFLMTFRDRLDTAPILGALCGVVAAYGGVLFLLLRRYPAREVGLLGIGLDIVVVTLAVYFSAGALDSYLLYGLVIMTVALRFGLAASVWTSLVASFMYAAVTFTSGQADVQVRELLPVRVAYLITIGLGTGLVSRVVLERAGENARLAQRLSEEERERSAVRERELLSQLQREFIESLDQRTTADAIVRGAAPLLGDVTWLALADGPDGPLRLAAAAGRDPVLAAKLRTHLESREIRFGEGVAGSAAATATSVVASDGGVAPSTGDADGLEATGLRSALAVPILTRGVVRGVLVSASRRAIAGGELRIAEAIAERAGPALENASLWADLQRRMDREHEAQRIKDDFLSIVSHELRTPLTSIQGYSQLLEGRLLTDAPRHSKELSHLQVVRSQVSRMRRLVDDLLDVSRIDRRGVVSIDPGRFDLAELVREAVARSRRQHGRREIAVDAPDRLEVEADRDRIDQVVTNLLDNAVKYSPEGGPVSVRLVRDGREAHLSVSDTGIGIPSEHLHHVFERFYQADGDASRRRFGGLGLGLYISRAIVEAHGGSIAAAPNPAGRGSVFSFHIPLRSAAEAASPIPAAGEPPPFVVRRGGS